MPIKGLMWGECEDVRDGYLVLIPFEDEGSMGLEDTEAFTEPFGDVFMPCG